MAKDFINIILFAAYAFTSEYIVVKKNDKKTTKITLSYPHTHAHAHHTSLSNITSVHSAGQFVKSTKKIIVLCLTHIPYNLHTHEHTHRYVILSIVHIQMLRDIPKTHTMHEHIHI